MKRLIYITLFTYSFLGCSDKNSLSEDNLRGSVSSIEIIHYAASSKFGEVIKDSCRWKETIKYDDNGNKIEHCNYSCIGILKSKITWKYDDSGNKISEIGNGHYTWKYDESGKAIEMNGFDYDGSLMWKTKYEYDQNGNQVEWNTYYGNGNLMYKNIGEYDNRGNQIEERSYKPDGRLTSKNTRKYDYNGNKIEHNRYSKDGSIFMTEIFEYDDNGNVIEIITTRNDGYKSNTSYEYKFDKKGNWIEKVIFSGIETSYIEERSIKYNP